MSVWFCIPSARPIDQSAPVFAAWRARGYKIAIVTDDEQPRPVDLQVVADPYPGYAQSVNYLAKRVLAENPDCEWIVTGGDDTYPDPNKTADEIAAELGEHYGGTFGVMQPTGDRWAGGSIDRICGSPWLGHEFCERAYGGGGPYWSGYRHMFLDEELQEVAIKLGILWQRPDLTHHHEHFMRRGDHVVTIEPPTFLAEANSPEHWNKFKAVFDQRKAAGFPGHQPIPA